MAKPFDQVSVVLKLEMLRRLLTSLGVLAANPWAFAIVALYGVLWLTFDRSSFDFNAVATLAVWCMTLLIQRAANRDMQAMHAKLDELLHSQDQARNNLTLIDDKELEEIVQHRIHARKDD